jgi:hypothetical protein
MRPRDVTAATASDIGAGRIGVTLDLGQGHDIGIVVEAEARRAAIDRDDVDRADAAVHPHRRLKPADAAILGIQHLRQYQGQIELERRHRGAPLMVRFRLEMLALEVVANVVQRLRVDRRDMPVVERVVGASTVTAEAHQAARPQHPEVVRHRRLALPDGGGEVADAKLVSVERRHHPHSRRIGDRSEKVGQLPEHRPTGEHRPRGPHRLDVDDPLVAGRRGRRDELLRFLRPCHSDPLSSRPPNDRSIIIHASRTRGSGSESVVASRWNERAVMLDPSPFSRSRRLVPATRDS